MDEIEIFRECIKPIAYHSVFQAVLTYITYPLDKFCILNANKYIRDIFINRLMLLTTTIQYVSREAFRKSCISQTRSHNWPQVINLLWLGLPSVIISSLVFCSLWLHWLDLPAEQYANDYKFAVYMTGVSCVVESFVEPVYVFSQAFKYLKLRLFVDCIGIFVNVGILAIAAMYYPDYLIRAMAYGQFAVSAISAVLYWVFFYKEFERKRGFARNRNSHNGDPLLALPFDSLRNLMPQSVPGQAFIGKDLAASTWSFIKQGIFKQLLRDGERYMMLFTFLSFTQQDIHDTFTFFETVYFRSFFLRIEESLLSYFAQMLNRQIPIEEQPRQIILQAASLLNKLLRGSIFYGAVLMVIAFSIHRLLHYTNGAILVSNTHALVYGFMFINVVTEAYVSAAMNAQELDKYTRFTMLLSCIYLCLSWLLSSALGDVGFFLAHCIKLVLQYSYSLWFINNQYHNIPCMPLRGVIPSPMVGICLIIAVALGALF